MLSHRESCGIHRYRLSVLGTLRYLNWICEEMSKVEVEFIVTVTKPSSVDASIWLLEQYISRRRSSACFRNLVDHLVQSPVLVQLNV